MGCIMGRINDEVKHGHLSRFPDEEAFLRPLLTMFDVTWGAQHNAFGSFVSVYFLKPEESTKAILGFEKEVLLVYSSYKSIEPRLFQLVSRFLTELPAKGRVETLCFILISDAPNVRDSVSQIMNSSVESKSVIPFNRFELLKGADSWFVRNRFTNSLYSRDLFDIAQALVEDTFFFGRQPLVHDIIDRFKRGQNTGLFGLRKMGKTSMIYKLKRVIEETNIGYHVVLDAQDPSIYMNSWWTLLGVLVDAIAYETKVTLPAILAEALHNESTAAQAFSKALDHIFMQIQAEQRVFLVIDEIEHLCPNLALNEQWNNDFLPFWKSVRAYQTRQPRLGLMIVGVNPQALETTTINGFDNPIFSFITQKFMPSFSKEEVREMVRTLGRYMGIKFDDEAYEYLRVRYGGHPMLVRLACSWVHKEALQRSGERPVQVSKKYLIDTQSMRDNTLVPYAKHIVEVLKAWYPIEYDMFEMLCQGHQHDYQELAGHEPQLLEHLLGYGLVTGDGGSDIVNEIVAEFVRNDAQSLERSRSKSADDKQHEKTKDSAQSWSSELEKLADAVVHSRTFCQELAPMQGISPIFSDDKVRVGVKLADLRVTPLSQTRQQFESAVNTLQQLFWDCISDKQFNIKYPKLYSVSNRIRCLRHYFHHSDLSDKNVLRTAIETFQESVGGFPSESSEWAKVHLKLMDDLVMALKETQTQMFSIKV